MKKYHVTGNYITTFGPLLVEAENRMEAKEKFYKMWDDGNIIIETKEVQPVIKELRSA